jgi:hypothetical protein
MFKLFYILVDDVCVSRATSYSRLRAAEKKAAASTAAAAPVYSTSSSSLFSSMLGPNAETYERTHRPWVAAAAAAARCMQCRPAARRVCCRRRDHGRRTVDGLQLFSTCSFATSISLSLSLPLSGAGSGRHVYCKTRLPGKGERARVASKTVCIANGAPVFLFCGADSRAVGRASERASKPVWLARCIFSRCSGRAGRQCFLCRVCCNRRGLNGGRGSRCPWGGRKGEGRGKRGSG